MTSLDEMILEHLQNNAIQYFPDLNAEQIKVILDSVDRRLNSTLFHYHITDGTSHYPVIAKARTKGQQFIQKEMERPYRFTLTEGDVLSLEANALSTIYSHFQQQDNPNLKAIRFLDVLPDHQVIIMIESFDKSLRSFILKQNHLQRLKEKVDLEPAFLNAGAWLRSFHSLPTDEETIICYETSQTYLEVVEKLIEFAKKYKNDEQYFDHLLAKIKQHTVEILPEALPLGRLHGDYAPRNILLSDNHQITGIDTLARWHAPVYEDIATFLNWLWINQYQVHSQGLMFSAKLLNRYQAAFLRGYFGPETVPTTRIALFRIMVMIEYWVDRIEYFQRRRSAKQYLPDLLRKTLGKHRYKRIIAQLLREIDLD